MTTAPFARSASVNGPAPHPAIDLSDPAADPLPSAPLRRGGPAPPLPGGYALDADTFFRDYFGKQHLHVKGTGERSAAIMVEGLSVSVPGKPR